MSTDVESTGSSRAAGRTLRGVLMGILLVPAICGLVSIVGNISAFAYQGF